MAMVSRNERPIYTEFCVNWRSSGDSTKKIFSPIMGCCSPNDNQEESSQSDKDTLLFSKTEAPVGFVQKMKSAFLRLPTSFQIVGYILAVFLFGILLGFLMNVGRTGNDGGRTENFWGRKMDGGAQKKKVQGAPYIFQSDFPPAELLIKGFFKKSNVAKVLPADIDKLIARFLKPLGSIHLRSTGEDLCSTHAVLQCVLATDPYLMWALNTSEHKHDAGKDLSHFAKIYTDPISAKINSGKKDYVDVSIFVGHLRRYPPPTTTWGKFFISPRMLIIHILNLMNQVDDRKSYKTNTYRTDFEIPTCTTIHSSDIRKDVTKVEDLLDNPNEFDDQEILIVELDRILTGSRALDTPYNPQPVAVSERLDGTDKELYAAVIHATHANPGDYPWHFAAVVKKNGKWIRYSEDKDPVYLGSQLEDIKDFDSTWNVLFFRNPKHFA
eukprot:797333_1